MFAPVKNNQDDIALPLQIEQYQTLETHSNNR